MRLVHRRPFRPAKCPRATVPHCHSARPTKQRRRTALRVLDGRANQAFVQGWPQADLPQQGQAQQGLPEASPPPQQQQQQPSPSPAAAAAATLTPEPTAAAAADAAARPQSWDEWCSHFEEQDAAGNRLDQLQEQLQRAVAAEDYAQAGRLQPEVARLAAGDAVAACRSRLQQALAAEDYAAAQSTMEQGLTWLEGWWVGRARRPDATTPASSSSRGVDPGASQAPGDPYGHLLHITAEYGRWTGRVYSPRDLTELMGWADGEQSSQVLFRFGHTAASGFRGGRGSSSSSSSGKVLSTLGYPMLELFVCPGGSSSSSSGAGSMSLQAVKLQTRQEVERQEAESLPAALLQRRTAQQQSGGSGVAEGPGALQRAGTVDFWFDFKQAGGEEVAVEIGMSCPQLPVTKQVVRLRPATTTSSGSNNKHNTAGSSGGSEVSTTSSSGREEVEGSGVMAALGWRHDEEAQAQQGVAAAAAGAAAAPAPGALVAAAAAGAEAKSPTLWSAEELEEVLETLEALKGMQGSGSSALGSAPTAQPWASQQQELQQQQQQEVAPEMEHTVADWYSPEPPSMSGASAAAGEIEREQLMRQLYEEAWGIPLAATGGVQDQPPAGNASSSSSSSRAKGGSGTSSSSSSSSSDGQGVLAGSSSSGGRGADDAPACSGGLFRQALGQGLADDEEAELLELQRSPARVTQQGRDRFLFHTMPAASSGSSSSSSGRRGPMGTTSTRSSSSSREAAMPTDSSPSSSSSEAEEEAAGRCVVLLLPVTHTRQRSLGSGPLWEGPGASAWAGLELEAELAVQLGEVEASIAVQDAAAPAAAAAAAAGAGAGVAQQQPGRLQRQAVAQVQQQQQQQRGDGSWGVWERAAREVVERQVALSGRPLPEGCVGLLASALQSHSRLLAWRGLKVSPGALLTVDDVAADYRPQGQTFTYSRLDTQQYRTDPFTGLYLGAFGPHGHELLHLHREVDEAGEEVVVAVKLTGDTCVPAGVTSFTAKVGRRHRQTNQDHMYPEDMGVVARYPGQGRVAQPGFQNPRWVDGELVQFSSSRSHPGMMHDAELGFLWAVPGETRYLIMLKRLHLEDLE